MSSNPFDDPEDDVLDSTSHAHSTKSTNHASGSGASTAAPLSGHGSAASFYASLALNNGSSGNVAATPAPHSQHHTPSHSLTSHQGAGLAALYAQQATVTTPNTTATSSHPSATASAASAAAPGGPLISPASQTTSSSSHTLRPSPTPSPAPLITSSLPSHSTSTPAVVSSSDLPILTHDMSLVMQRFDHPHIDLTASEQRVLYHEGPLLRAARFKNVERFGFLFNDLFVLAEKNSQTSALPWAKAKLHMKQTFRLDECKLEDHSSCPAIPNPSQTAYIIPTPANTKKVQPSFTLHTSEKPLVFLCNTLEQCHTWVRYIYLAMTHFLSTTALKGSNANTNNKMKDPVFGDATIFTALEQKNDDVLLHFLNERGDDPNEIFNPQGLSPLQYAILHGNSTAVSLLLAHGANIEQTNDQGLTPIHLAALNDEYGILMVLISRSANLQAKDLQGRSVLWPLLSGPHRSAAEEEQRRLALSGKTPQQRAAEAKEKQQKKEMKELKRKQKIEEHAKKMQAKRAAAAAKKNKKKASKKNKNNSSDEDTDSNQSDNDGNDDDDYNSSDFLSDDDEDDEEEDESTSEERTLELLQQNKWKNLRETFYLLLEQGIDVEEKDAMQRTVLMHLAALHHHESVELLVSTKQGNQNAYSNIALSNQKNSNTNATSSSSSSKHNVATPTSNVSLDSIDPNGFTPLHYAVSMDLSLTDQFDIDDVVLTVKALLNAGASPNIRDHQLNTPLHLARHLSLACTLVVHGARYDLKNLNSMKPITHWEEQQARGDVNEPVKALQEARQAFQDRPDTKMLSDERIEEKGSGWLHDEMSDICLLCMEKFSLTRRKHHCRRCGILCCSACSSKRFTLIDPRTSSGGTLKSKDDTEHRACDGCFNFLSHKHNAYAKIQRAAAAAKRAEEARIERDRQEVLSNFQKNHDDFLRRSAEEEKRLQERQKRKDEGKPPAGIQPRGSTSSSSASGAGAGAGAAGAAGAGAGAAGARRAQGAAAQTQETMAQNRQLLLQRGEKLSQMEDKSQRMADDAENFASLAAQLKEKQKKSWF